MFSGVLFGLSYALLSALSLLFIDKLIANIGVFTALFLTTLIAFFYYTLCNFKKLNMLYMIICKEWRLTLLINITVVFMWGFVYFGLKFMLPVEFIFLFELFCALTAIMLQKQYVTMLLCLMMLVGYLIFAKASAIGLMLAAVGGASAFFYAKLTRSLAQKRNLKPSSLLAVRFMLLLLVTIGFVNLRPLSWHDLQMVSVVAVISYVLPIYCLQKCICQLGAETASFLATATPLFTYLLQAIFLHTYSWFMLVLSFLLVMVLNFEPLMTFINQKKFFLRGN